MSNGLKKLYNLRNPSPSEMRGTGLFIHIEGAVQSHGRSSLVRYPNHCVIKRVKDEAVSSSSS